MTGESLVRLTTVLAIAAPIVIFGFLYTMGVRPERAAASRALQQLEVERAHLARRSSVAETSPAVAETSAVSEFDARTTDNDRAPEIAASISALLTSVAAGAVSNISVETGAPADGRLDPLIGRLGRPVAFTPVTVSFDAPFEQIRYFFQNLKGLPTTFELRSVELARRRGTTMHVKAVLLVFHRQMPASELSPASVGTPAKAASAPAPRTSRALPQADPVVSGIVLSGTRRAAVVDGRVVAVGDRIGQAVVKSIDQDGVTIITAEGQARRLAFKRP